MPPKTACAPPHKGFLARPGTSLTCITVLRLQETPYITQPFPQDQCPPCRLKHAQTSHPCRGIPCSRLLVLPQTLNCQREQVTQTPSQRSSTHLTPLTGSAPLTAHWPGPHSPPLSGLLCRPCSLRLRSPAGNNGPDSTLSTSRV